MIECDFPVPQLLTRNDGRAIVIARSRRRPRPGPPAISRSLPLVPEGYENVYRPRG